MTDRIACPECAGRTETHIGSLRLRCRFCHGRGVVGGGFEPAEGGRQRRDGYRKPEEGEQYDPDEHGPLPAVWEHPVTSDLGCCRTCLGAGEVMHLGDIYRARAERGVMIPCPACS